MKVAPAYVVKVDPHNDLHVAAYGSADAARLVYGQMDLFGARRPMALVVKDRYYDTWSVEANGDQTGSSCLLGAIATAGAILGEGLT